MWLFCLSVFLLRICVFVSWLYMIGMWLWFFIKFFFCLSVGEFFVFLELGELCFWNEIIMCFMFFCFVFYIFLFLVVSIFFYSCGFMICFGCVYVVFLFCYLRFGRVVWVVRIWGLVGENGVFEKEEMLVVSLMGENGKFGVVVIDVVVVLLFKGFGVFVRVGFVKLVLIKEKKKKLGIICWSVCCFSLCWWRIECCKLR